MVLACPRRKDCQVRDLPGGKGCTQVLQLPEFVGSFPNESPLTGKYAQPSKCTVQWPLPVGAAVLLFCLNEPRPVSPEFDWRGQPRSVAAARGLAAGAVGVAAEGVRLGGSTAHRALHAPGRGADIDEEADPGGAVLVRLHLPGGIAEAGERPADAVRGEVAAPTQRFECTLDASDGGESLAAALAMERDGNFEAVVFGVVVGGRRG